jgi:RNA polymerase sigma-70 factor (ECF subfamily)
MEGGFNVRDASLDANDSVDVVMTIYSNMVYRLALIQTKNKADAEDVFQEVFLRYVRSKTHFQSEEHRKAWLLKVTMNCSRKLLYSAWFRHTVPLNEDIKFETKDEGDVLQAVLDLPLKYRNAIYLFYYSDLTLKEIGEILSLNTSTVKTHLFRAKQILKQKLKGDFDYE